MTERDHIDDPKLSSKAAKAAEDAEIGGDQRSLRPWEAQFFFWLCIAYTSFHIWSLNFYPIDPWIYRSIIWGCYWFHDVSHAQVGKRCWCALV